MILPKKLSDTTDILTIFSLCIYLSSLHAFIVSASPLYMLYLHLVLVFILLLILSDNSRHHTPNLELVFGYDRLVFRIRGD